MGKNESIERREIIDRIDLFMRDTHTGMGTSTGTSKGSPGPNTVANQGKGR